MYYVIAETQPRWHPEFSYGALYCAANILSASGQLQFLVMYHGATNKSIREAGTLNALKRLHAHRIIGDDEAAALRDDYIFLRVLEHQFQVAGDQQRHQLPDDPRDLMILAPPVSSTLSSSVSDRAARSYVQD